MLILTLCVQLFIEDSPNVTEFCTEMNRVIRFLQAYKDSDMVVMGDCNDCNIFLCTKSKTNDFKQVINAKTTRGFDLVVPASFATENKVC